MFLHLHVVLSEVLVQLLQEHERQNGVGTQTEEVRREALPQRGHSLRLHDLPHAVERARVLVVPTSHTACQHSLHHLQAGLHDIHGQRHHRAEEAGRERGRDVQAQTVGLEQMPLVIVQLLRLRVAAQLRRVQHHRAHHRGGGALPQRLHALLLADAVDGLDAVRVAAALLGGQAVIGGSADQRDLGGIAHHGTAGASDHAAAHLLEEAHALAILSLAAPVQAAVIHTQTRGGVRDLTKNSGGIAAHERHSTTRTPCTA